VLAHIGEVCSKKAALLHSLAHGGGFSAYGGKCTDRAFDSQAVKDIMLEKCAIPLASAPTSSNSDGGQWPANRRYEVYYFDAESFDIRAIASCTVVINCAGKMMVEFLSTEISAIVWRVRS
jgi:hypothetical protein